MNILFILAKSEEYKNKIELEIVFSFPIFELFYELQHISSKLISLIFCQVLEA